MANTVYGPYVSTAWTAGVTALSQSNMNNIETSSSVALHGFNSDHIGASFVLSGCAVTGSVGTTTVNIASGVVYTVMTDGTVGRITVGATTQTTVTPSSTYHLYVQPDGTFYWSTSNSPAANSAALANVATNGSGQIASITDQRSFNFPLFSGAAGLPLLGEGAGIGIASDSTHYSTLKYVGASHYLSIANSERTGNTGGVYFEGTDGTFGYAILSLGAQFNSAATWLDLNGVVKQVAGRATAGNFGVAPVANATIDQTVSNNSDTKIVDITTPAHTTFVRVSGSFAVGAGNTNNGTITFRIAYTDPVGANGLDFLDAGNSAIIGAATYNKGGTMARVMPLCVEASGSTSFQVWYRNNVAGTISDKVSVIVEFLN